MNWIQLVNSSSQSLLSSDTNRQCLLYFSLWTWTFCFFLTILTCSILDLSLTPLQASWHWHLTILVSVTLCSDDCRKRSDGVWIPEPFDNQWTMYVWFVLSQFFLSIKDTHENILTSTSNLSKAEDVMFGGQFQQPTDLFPQRKLCATNGK